MEDDHGEISVYIDTYSTSIAVDDFKLRAKAFTRGRHLIRCRIEGAMRYEERDCLLACLLARIGSLLATVVMPGPCSQSQEQGIS